MYYYLIVVKKMYIIEPHDPSPVTVSGPMKAVIYVGLAGTLVIGIYPQPFIDWVVAATMMFSNLGRSRRFDFPLAPLSYPSAADCLSPALAIRDVVLKISLAGSDGPEYSLRGSQTLTRRVSMHYMESATQDPPASTTPSAQVPSEPEPSGPVQQSISTCECTHDALRHGFANWSIEQRVLAGFGLVFAGILVISAVSYRNTSSGDPEQPARYAEP